MDIIELMQDKWIIDADSKKVIMWYSASRGNYNRKAFIFPREILIDKIFAEAIGMILGDGDMHRVDKKHFTYTSKDIDISVFVLNFLRKRLWIENKDITFAVRYRYIDPKIDELAVKLLVNKSNIKSYFTSRTNYPSLHIQVNGAVFRELLEKLVENFMNSDFVSNTLLRRGFLRGIFAAEGCVCVNHTEYFINAVSFTLSIKEQDIVVLIETSLRLEGITYKTVVRKNVIDVLIFNWKNYLKCWNIGLFDRCSRKKEKFLSIVKESKVCAVVEKSDLTKLSKSFTQRELASIIGSWQGNVCKLLQGKFLLTLKQIRILEEKGFTFNINKLRIGNLTELPWNENTKTLFVT